MAIISFNINWRDVQTKNVVNNVDMACLRAPWQNGKQYDTDYVNHLGNISTIS